MPTPVLRANSIYTGGGTVTAVPLVIPASVVAGDYLYAFIGSTSTVSGAPVGWTSVDVSNVPGNLNSADRGLFRRVAQAGDAGTTVNFPILSGVGSGIMVAYKNVSGQDVFASNATVGTSPTSWASAPVTTTQANDLIVTFFVTEAQSGAAQTIGLPATAQVTANSYDALGVSDFVKATAGVTAAQTATGLAGPWGAYTVALLATPNSPPTPPTVTAPNGGELVNNTVTITWTAGTDPDGDALTYDIDYSLNNGGAWTNLVNGVSGLSYVWNTTAIASSASCLVRVRSSDTSSAKSAYDQSNAVFTIQHNLPPNPATWASPPNNTTLDRSVSQTLTFNFLDPNAGDVMTKFDWRYRLIGAGTWTTTGTQMGATPSLTLAGGSVAAGTYEIQVLTYDGLGTAATGWSASLQFVMADAPPTPAITTPASGGTVSTSSGVAAWTVANQTGYQVQQIADNAGVMADPNVPANVYSDTGQIVSAGAVTVRNTPQTYPVNNRFEWVRIRIQNSGLWSAWTSIRYQVAYSAPAVVTIGVSAPPTIPDILRVTITNPTPVGSQPVVATIELWRQRISDQAGALVLNEAPTRVATMPPTPGGVTVFDDASVRSGHGYQYQAVVIGVNNVVTRSPWVV